MKVLPNQEFLQETVSYWDGAFSLIDEDLPDGVYMQMLKDTVNDQFKDCCEMLEVSPQTGIDANHVVSFWVSWKALNTLTEQSQELGFYDE